MKIDYNEIEVVTQQSPTGVPEDSQLLPLFLHFPACVLRFFFLSVD
jgi:hypothetical protein